MREFSEDCRLNTFPKKMNGTRREESTLQKEFEGEMVEYGKFENEKFSLNNYRLDQ